MREFVFILFEMKAKMKIVGISLGNTTNKYITQNRSDAIGDKVNAIQKREEKKRNKKLTKEGITQNTRKNRQQ